MRSRIVGEILSILSETQLHSSIGDLQASRYFMQIAAAILDVAIKFPVGEPAEHSKIWVFAHVFVDGVARNMKRASRSGRLKVVAGKRLGNSVVADGGGWRGDLRRGIPSAKYGHERGRDLSCRVASTVDRQLGCEIA